MHQNVLAGNITASNLKTGAMLRGMQGWFHANGGDQHLASRRAWGTLYGMTQRPASRLSFAEAFWVMGVLFLAILPFVLLRNPRAKSRTQSPAPTPGKTIEVHEEAQEEAELLLVQG